MLDYGDLELGGYRAPQLAETALAETSLVILTAAALAAQSGAFEHRLEKWFPPEEITEGRYTVERKHPIVLAVPAVSGAAVGWAGAQLAKTAGRWSTLAGAAGFGLLGLVQVSGFTLGGSVPPYRRLAGVGPLAAALYTGYAAFARASS